MHLLQWMHRRFALRVLLHLDEELGLAQEGAADLHERESVVERVR